MLLVHTGDPERYSELGTLISQLDSDHAETTQCRIELGDLIVDLPIVAGLPARVLIGTERTLLIDYQAEIAPNTWMPAPRSESIFDGLAWQARLQGKDLVGECFRSTTSEVRVRHRSEASLGSVQLPDREHAVGRGRLAAGESAAWIAATEKEPGLSVMRGQL